MKTTAIVLFAALAWLPGAAHAKLKVVTTLPSFADIARSVGGDEVSVTSLTRGNQDPHFVDPKPDLVLALNRADLLIRAGLGLEDGWLPPLQSGARNGRIQNGADGNLDASTAVELRDVPQGPVDRSQGDVHPGGNPHFMADPRNGIALAKAVARRLSKLQPDKEADFGRRAAELERDLKKRIAAWERELKPLAGKPVVTYHRSWGYFSAWAGLKEVGYVEPKPGIPPSPSHLVKLIAEMRRARVKAVLMEPYYPRGAAEEAAAKGGAQLLVLPLEPGATPETGGYAAVFDHLVAQLKAAAQL